MSITTRKNAQRSQGILTDWKKRFIDAYDVELQDFIEGIKVRELTGPTAWDGFAASVASDACVKAQESGEIVNIDMPPRPPFYR